MFTPFARRICLSLQSCVRVTHYALADVVETVGRVMRYFLFQFNAAVALLEVYGEVGEAVQLVKDRHHVRRSVVAPVYSCNVGFG
jgi:hypothetical protein